MLTHIKNIVKEFALAHIDAKDNPKLLCEDYARYRDLCIARMKRIKIADDALFGLKDEADLPKLVLNFFEASDDRGCNHCWLSTSPKDQHSECNVKIKRWFKTRDDLISYGETL